VRTVARTLGPLVGALLAAGVLAGACFGVLRVALPRATEGQRLAARTLLKLDAWHSQGALVRIGDRTLAATCTPVRRGAVITYADGVRILVRGRHVRALQPLGSMRDRLLATTTTADPELVSAEALLGGSRSLLVAGLAVRLSVIGDPLVARTQIEGTPAYVFRLGRDRPLIELVVSGATLEPLAVRYSSARLHGTSRLVATPARRLAAVGARGC
jgi:hypothetical protein